MSKILKSLGVVAVVYWLLDLLRGAVGDTFAYTDGESVTVDLLYTVTAKQVAVVEGWLGIVVEGGASGDMVALDIASKEYQMYVPAGLSVSKGDIIYIEVADVTGHTPDDTAYGTSSGAGKTAFMKATSDKDVNNVVTGILMVK